MSSSNSNNNGSDMNNVISGSNVHYPMMMNDLSSALPLQSSSSNAGIYSSPRHYDFPSSSAANYGTPISGITQDSWNSPGYRASGNQMTADLYNNKGFSSIRDMSKRRGHDDIDTTTSTAYSDELMARLGSDISVDIVDGALELSAGAKEFVPSSARVKEYSPGYGTSMSNPSVPALTPAGSSLGGLAHHQHQHYPLLYQPSSSSSSLLGTGTTLISQPPGIMRGSIPPMPPLTLNQAAWKHHTAPFMNGSTHVIPHRLDPPMQSKSQGHSMFMPSYDHHSSFHAGSSTTADSDAYEYDPSDAIMTNIDSFLSTDN